MSKRQAYVHTVVAANRMTEAAGYLTLAADDLELDSEVRAALAGVAKDLITLNRRASNAAKWLGVVPQQGAARGPLS